MSKCLGCGAELQSIDFNLEGFTKLENVDYCERCFRIKNYGDYKSIVKDNNTFISILKDINRTDSLVLLVLDLFNLPENLDIIKENIDNSILLVLTKRDILPKIIYEQRLLDYMDKYNLDFVDSIIISSNNNYNLDELMNKINNYKIDQRVYVVGFTNAGKSTLINKIVYNYSDLKPTITTSLLPSTTLNNIEIKLNDDLVLIDTPGLLEKNSIDNFIDVKTLKKITPTKEIKPITYQIKRKQFIQVDNLLELELSNNNVTLYMSNSLKIDKSFNEKLIDLDSHFIDVEPNMDVVISGLGFIKFNKFEKIHLKVIRGTKVYCRKSLI